MKHYHQLNTFAEIIRSCWYPPLIWAGCFLSFFLCASYLSDDDDSTARKNGVFSFPVWVYSEGHTLKTSSDDDLLPFPHFFFCFFLSFAAWRSFVCCFCFCLSFPFRQFFFVLVWGEVLKSQTFRSFTERGWVGDGVASWWKLTKIQVKRDLYLTFPPRIEIFGRFDFLKTSQRKVKGGFDEEMCPQCCLGIDKFYLRSLFFFCERREPLEFVWGEGPCGRKEGSGGGEGVSTPFVIMRKVDFWWPSSSGQHICWNHQIMLIPPADVSWSFSFFLSLHILPVGWWWLHSP